MTSRRRPPLALLLLAAATLLAAALPAAAAPPVTPECGAEPYIPPPPFPLGIGVAPAAAGPPRAAAPGIGSGQFPTSGQAAVIILAVQFTDKQFDFAAMQALQGSVTDAQNYYLAQSGGAFQLTLDVPRSGGMPAVYTLPNTMGYYGTGNTMAGYSNLVRDAVNAAQGDVTFRNYQGVMILHAGMGDESVAGDGPEIHSVYYNEGGLPIVTVNQGGQNVSVYGATIVPEDQEGEYSPYGTVLHEFGHQLGLADFYDTRSSGTYVGSVGEWGLMGSGNWGYPQGEPNKKGAAPASLMAYNRVKLGWVQPMTMLGNFFGERKLAHAAGDVYRVWTNGEASPAAEHFLFEVRALTAEAPYTPGFTEGLLIWRVQPSLGTNSRDYPTGVLCELIQADGFGNMNRLESDPYSSTGGDGKQNRGDAYDIYPGSVPNTDFSASTTPSSRSWAGADTLVAARNIAKRGSGATLVVDYDAYVKVAMEKVSGDAQSGTVGQALAAPFVVRVRDGAGVPKAGVSVSFTVKSGTGAVSPASAVSDANGLVSVSYRPDSAGAHAVEVSSSEAAGPGVDGTLTFTCTATVSGGPVVDAGRSSLSVQPASAPADGQTAIEATVVARTAAGEPVAGVTVTLAASPSAGTSVSPSSALTDSSGVARFSVVATVFGERTLSAVAGGVTLTETAVVFFNQTGPRVSATLSTVSASPASLPADGTSAATVTVTAKDSAGAAVAGVAVTLSVSGSGNSVSPAQATADAQGRAVFTVKSTVAEAKTVTATADGVAISQTAAVTFTPTGQDISAANSSVAVFPATLPADGTSAATVTVTVRNAANAAVAGATASITVTGANAVSPATAVTGSDGRAVFTVTSAEPGTKTVSASAGGVLITQTATVTFTPVARVVSPGLSTAAVSKTTAVADGIDAVAVNVVVRDTTGALYPGVTVALAPTGTGNTVTPASAVTDSQGACAFSLQSTAPGTKEIAVTADGVTLAARPAVLFTPRPRYVSPDLSTVAASPTSVFADGIQYATIVVTVRDMDGAAYAGRAVSVAASGSGNTVDPAQATSGADGRATFTLRSTVAGMKTVSANADGVTLAQKPQVNFVVEGVSAVKSRVEAAPLSGVRANGTDFVTITVTVVNVLDQYVQGTVPVIAVGGSGNRLDPAVPAPTDANGRTTVRLTATRAEAKNIRVTVGGVLLADSPTVSFSPGAAVRMEIVSATNNQSGPAGGSPPSPLKVRAFDANDNPAPGASVNFAITARPEGESGGAVQSPVVTDVNGEAAAALSFGTKAGVWRIEAASGGLVGSPVSFTATSTAGAPAALAKVAGQADQTGVVFTALAAPLAVRVTDAFGNPRSGVGVLWSVAASPAGSSGALVSPAQTFTDQAGVARTTATLGSKVGGYTFRAAATGLAGSPVDFAATATAGPAWRLELLAGDGQTGVAGSILPTAFRARVTDSGGNGVQGAAVTFRVTSGGGSFVEAMPRAADASGVATATFRLPQTAGAVTLAVEAAAALGGSLAAGATAVAGPAAALLSVAGAGQSGTVGEWLVMPLAVRAADIYGNPVAGVAVTFSVAAAPAGSAGAAVDPPGAFTAPDGTASFRLRLGDKAGAYAAAATAAGLAGSPVAFPATAAGHVPRPARSPLAASAPSPLTADGETWATVEVTLRDAFGNALAGLPASAVQVYTDTLGDRVAAAADLADPAGRLAFRVAATRIGARVVRARAQGVTLAATATLVFTPGPPDLARCGISADPPGNLKVPLEEALVTVTLLDRFLNPVAGYDAARVLLASDKPAVTRLTQPSGAADGEGRVFGQLGCNEAGFRTITATVDGRPLSAPLVVSFVTSPLDPARTRFELVSGENVVANGNDGYVMRLTVFDTDGAPVTGIPVSAIECRDDAGGDLFGVARSATDGAGQCLVDVRSRVSGARVVRPYVSGVRFDDDETLTFLPGAAVALEAAGARERQAAAGEPLAGSLAVRAVDAHGNGVPGVEVTFALQSPGGATGQSLLPASASTDAGGQAAAAFVAGSLAGTYVVRAAAAGLAGSPVTFTVAVGPGAASTFLVTPPGLAFAAGETVNGVVVECFDRFGNAKTDYVGSVWFASTDPSAVLPYLPTRRYAFTEADQGRAVFDGFVFLTEGSHTLECRDGAIAGASAQIAVSPPASESIRVAPFRMPGDAGSILAVIRPATGLTKAPEARYLGEDGSTVLLRVSTMRNNVYMAVGRAPAGAANGTVLVIGRRAGTAEVVSGRAPVR